jgi:hypothetical protein
MCLKQKKNEGTYQEKNSSIAKQKERKILNTIAML